MKKNWHNLRFISLLENEKAAKLENKPTNDGISNKTMSVDIFILYIPLILFCEKTRKVNWVEFRKQEGISVKSLFAASNRIKSLFKTSFF